MSKWTPTEVRIKKNNIKCLKNSPYPGIYKKYRGLYCSNLSIALKGTLKNVTDKNGIGIWIARVDRFKETILIKEALKGNGEVDFNFVYENENYFDELIVGLIFINGRKKASFTFSNFSIDIVKRPPPDVFVITLRDSGNTAWHHCRALRTIGLRTAMLKGGYHHLKFGGGFVDQPQIYPKMWKYMKEPNCFYPPKKDLIMKFLNISKFVIWYANSCIVPVLNNKERMKNSAHMCNGGFYRRQPSVIAKRFKYSPHTIALTLDLVLAPRIKQTKYIGQPFDDKEIFPSYSFSHPKVLTIGHFPSDPKKKGTDVFLQALDIMNKDPKFRKKFRYIGKTTLDIKQVTFKKQIKRYQQCDIYFEQLVPFLTYPKAKPGEQKTVRVGTWGASAIEAAAAGCIVLTSQFFNDQQNKEYPPHPFYVCNSLKQIIRNLRAVLSLSREEIQEKKKESRRWVESCLSYKPTAKRWWNQVLCPHFPDDRQKEIEEKIAR